MNTAHDSPSLAACADTLPARLPVEAHANIPKPSSTARVAATETTLSLYEQVGWFTESSLTYSSFTPSFAASRSARTSGVNPECRPVRGSPAMGSSSR